MTLKCNNRQILKREWSETEYQNLRETEEMERPSEEEERAPLREALPKEE